MKHIRTWFSLFLKGAGIGAANVIPGVSGGTIALITGVFEPLIHTLKTFDAKAFRLLFTGKWKELGEWINIRFLFPLFTGIVLSIFSLAKLLQYFFIHQPILVWSFFFGLILASVWFVAKRIKQWTVSTGFIFILGTAIAVAIALLHPASENSSIWYLFLCGVIAVCSMILPGLSGSFILLLMGNYELVMIRAVSDINLSILIPVGVGGLIGLLAFAHFLSWLFKKFHDLTLGLLSGFMFGSLLILWPWKEIIYRTTETGALLLSHSGKTIPESYHFWLPHPDINLLFSLLCIISGAVIIILLESNSKKSQHS